MLNTTTITTTTTIIIIINNNNNNKHEYTKNKNISIKEVYINIYF